MRVLLYSYKFRIVCGREIFCVLICSVRLGVFVMRDIFFMDFRVRDLEL